MIDDGSTDATAALVTSNLNRFPAVRLLVNERNMGFGWSYRRGVDAAALDHIVMVHGATRGATIPPLVLSHVGSGSDRGYSGTCGARARRRALDLERVHVRVT